MVNVGRAKTESKSPTDSAANLLETKEGVDSMPIMTDKGDQAKTPSPVDSGAAQAEPAGAQAVPSGSAKGQDQIIHDDVHVWESLGNGDGYRYRVPGGWLYTLNCAKDEDGPDRPVFVPEPRQ